MSDRVEEYFGESYWLGGSGDLSGDDWAIGYYLDETTGEEVGIVSGTALSSVVFTNALPDPLQTVISDGGSLTGELLCDEFSMRGDAAYVLVGSILASYGDIASDTTLTVDAGGSLLVSLLRIEGTAINATVNSGGIEAVSSGGTAISTSVNGGGSEEVAVGGRVISTTLSGQDFPDGESFQEVNGKAIDTIVDSFADQTVLSGGTASGTTLNSGGEQDVYSGGLVVSTTVNSGAVAGPDDGGAAIDTTVNSGGFEVVNGTDSSTTVNSGGYEQVNYDGTTSDTAINSGGLEVVSDGGVAEGTVVSSGGALVVLPGAHASGTVVLPGGAVIPPGVVVFSSAGRGFGFLVVSAVSGTLSGDLVVKEEAEDVFSGGTALSSLVSSGGVEVVSSGGTANDAVVSSGGVQSVGFGGTAGDTTVDGGMPNVLTGGQIVLSGGTASGTLLNNGALGQVFGAASDVTVDKGSIEYVFGSTIGDTVNSGGYEEVYSSGTASSAIVNVGGQEELIDGGTASGTTVNSGGYDAVDVSGTAYGTIVNSGGTEYVLSGGVANATALNGGGTDYVQDSGTAIGNTVNSGGYEDVYPGGTAIRGMVNSGGYEEVFSGGVASDTTLNSGAQLALSAGTALDITNFGTVIGIGKVDGSVLNDGSIIATGGSLVIAGAISDSGTLAVGFDGVLDLPSAVNNEQTVVFAGATGTLGLADLPSYTAPISGFEEGDVIDLVGATANEATFNSATGVLTLYDATYGESLTTVGAISVKGNYAPGEFQLSSDGDGGTDITLGEAGPSVNELADMSNAVYYQTSTVDGYQVVPTFVSSTNGFYAAAYQDGDQIVLAVRGTVIAKDPATVANLLADSSFLPGVLPNFNLFQYVAEASSLLDRIRRDFQHDQITLTGHSLGGAIAALLGYASGYETVSFDAPGAAQLETILGPFLAQAADANSGLAEPDYNYRLEGDQISLVGSQIGTFETVLNPGPTGWLSWLANHKLGALNTQLDKLGTIEPGASNAGIRAGPGIPDSILPRLITAAASVIVSSLVKEFTFELDAIAALLYAFYPSSAASYQMTESPASPEFASLTLPSEPGVASYDVTIETGTIWSSSEVVEPGATLTDNSGFDGFAFSAADSGGQTTTPADPPIFELSFVSAGTFDGTLTDTDAPCFAAGTRIATESGEVLVQSLRIGELVSLANGQSAQVKWLGFRRVDCHRHPKPYAVWPVRVAAGAFAIGQPRRELLLSPDHAVFVDGVLIPIRYLINGTTVAQIPIDVVSYWHVELQVHDVLLAERLPCESFLDTGNRAAFENGGAIFQMHPDFAARLWDSDSCAPLIVAGPQLAAIQTRLRKRASLLPQRSNRYRNAARPSRRAGEDAPRVQHG